MQLVICLFVYMTVHLVIEINCMYASICIDSDLYCRFEFIVSPIVHPRFYRNWKGPSGQRSEPLTRSDMLLSSSGMNGKLITESQSVDECVGLS